MFCSYLWQTLQMNLGLLESAKDFWCPFRRGHGGHHESFLISCTVHQFYLQQIVRALLYIYRISSWIRQLIWNVFHSLQLRRLYLIWYVISSIKLGINQYYHQNLYLTICTALTAVNIFRSNFIWMTSCNNWKLRESFHCSCRPIFPYWTMTVFVARNYPRSRMAHFVNQSVS